MSSHESKKSKQKKCKHTNSSDINQLVSEVKHLEKELKRISIAVVYPEQIHEHRPMIGHTKGNTSSNRKVIKKHQRQELEKIVAHLAGLLPNGTNFLATLRSGGSKSTLYQDVHVTESDEESEDYWALFDDTL
jgi:hypothetical protein